MNDTAPDEIPYYVVKWEDDWEVGSHVAEFDCYDTEPATCEVCLVYSPDGELLASLGCIDDATSEYRQTIERELVDEAKKAV
jgi:hypothetical protein